MVQGLELHALTVKGLGLIPGQGTKIPHASWHGKKKKTNPTTTACPNLKRDFAVFLDKTS